jgi:hypothetical protein
MADLQSEETEYKKIVKLERIPQRHADDLASSNRWSRLLFVADS